MRAVDLCRAEDDWLEDSRGEQFIDQSMYKNAIFQLCDLWTDTLDPDEYVHFLETLLVQMKRAGLGKKVKPLRPQSAQPEASPVKKLLAKELPPRFPEPRLVREKRGVLGWTTRTKETQWPYMRGDTLFLRAQFREIL